MDLFENWLPLLLTPKEIKDLQKRFRILTLLKTKLNYREIARKMKISTTTVVRLNHRLRIRKKKKIRNIKSNQKKNYKKLSMGTTKIVYKKKKLLWKFG